MEFVESLNVDGLHNCLEGGWTWSQAELDQALAHTITPNCDNLQHKQLQCIRMLLDGGADTQVEIKHKYGRRLLSIGVALLCEELVAVILAHPHTKRYTVEYDLYYPTEGSEYCEEGLVMYCILKQEDGVSILKMLLEFGMDADIWGQGQGRINERTGLMVASMMGNVECVRLLLQHGAKTLYREGGDMGETALSLAAFRGHTEVISLLLAAGADVNDIDNSGDTPLHNAVMNGKIDTVQELVKHGASVNMPDEEGRGPLVMALLGDCLGMTDYLLTAGADVNGTEHFTGTSVFVVLASRITQYKYKSFVQKGEYLLSKGADINMTNSMGMAPFLEVCRRGGDCHLTLPITYILELGAHMDVQDPDGCTPLGMLLVHMLTDDDENRNLLLEVMCQMLKKGINVNMLTHLWCERDSYPNHPYWSVSQPGMFELPLEIAVRSGLVGVSHLLWTAGSQHGELAKWLTIDHIPFYIRETESLQHEKMQTTMNNFLRTVHQPRSLMDCARIIIRTNLNSQCQRLDDKLTYANLGLPEVVCSYMALSDLDKIIRDSVLY